MCIQTPRQGGILEGAYELLTLVNSNTRSVHIPQNMMATKDVDNYLTVQLNAHEIALATILDEMRLEAPEIATIIDDVRFKKMQTHFQRLLGRSLRADEQNHLRQSLRTGTMSDRWLDEICDGK